MSSVSTPASSGAYRGEAPGVYVSWRPKPAKKPRYRTDIAGFVGVAAKGPSDRALRIERWADFIEAYGPPVDYAYLAYAVRGFFENGGHTCYVVRCVSSKAKSESLRKASPARPLKPPHIAVPLEPLLKSLDLLELPSGFPSEVSWTFWFEASSVGSWANDLTVKIRFDKQGGWQVLESYGGRIHQTRFGLFDILTPLKPETVKPGPGETQEADKHWISLKTKYDLTNVRFSIASDRLPEKVDVKTEEQFGALVGLSLVKSIPAAGLDVTLQEGEDGLESLNVNDFIGAPDGDAMRRGLALLEEIDEISLVAVPDAMMPLMETAARGVPGGSLTSTLPETRFTKPQIGQIQAAVVAQCEKRGDRFALNDPRPDQNTPSVFYDEYKNHPGSAFSAAYFPWLLVPYWGRSGAVRAVPPSGHVAGCIARRDLTVGVHAPPANLGIENVADVAVAVNPDDHGLLNEFGVNVITAVPGRGIRIMGARTQARLPGGASQRAQSDWTNWRYINVRRLFSAIVEQIEQEAAWTVFEPSGPTLWRGVERTVRGLLFSLWRAGALAGASADDAYFVRCDASTNPPDERERGRVTCLVGARPPWPAEFVVLQVGLGPGETEVEIVGGGIYGQNR